MSDSTPRATLVLASNVGAFVSATDVFDGALLAIALAAGSRGEHRVSVLDPRRAYAQVASFPIPSRARSGISPLHGDGDRLLAADDHTLAAFDPRTGKLLWERSFPAPSRVRLVDVRAGRLLVSVEPERNPPETWLLRGSDGTDEVALPEVLVGGVLAPCLGPNGELALAYLRTVTIARPNGDEQRFELAPRRFGVVDATAFDDTGARLVMGTRAGEVLVLDTVTGVATTILETDEPVRCVGFHRGVPWAMDARARLRIFGEGAAQVSVDLGVSTYGGLLAKDGATIALSDLDTRTFRIRRLADNKELFATVAGFRCEAIAIAHDGALLVSSAKTVVRIDAESGHMARLAGVHAASELRRMPNGSIALLGGSLEILVPGAEKPVKLARDAEEVVFAQHGALMVASHAHVVEIWDVASATRTWRIDLDDTWVGETSEAVRLAHLGPDGRPWIHLTDGQILRGDALDGDDADDTVVHRLPSHGTLYAHPDGQTLLRVHEHRLTRLDLQTFEESAPFDLPSDINLSALRISPSGKRVVVFHRNGRLTSVDLETRAAVAIDSPETAAAERSPNETYIIDLQTPLACAFSRDESRFAWTHAGGITFADAVTGHLVGRLLIASSGRDYVLTDGTSFDGPAVATSKRTFSPEIIASEGGVPLDAGTVRARHRSGLLGTLT